MSTPPTASSLGLLRCAACGLICRAGHDLVSPHCPRCGAPLSARKTDSVRRTWAYLIAAMILYIPANLLPIMRTTSLTYDSADTIVGGVGVLWRAGSWDLAVIVFVASVVVPVLKIGALGWLLFSVQRGSTQHLALRARLYRVLEFIGHWSMLDVFVVALLVAMVNFHSVAEVRAGPGAIAFGAVVVLTMLASMSFDPRLIWDAAGKQDD